MSVKRVYPAAWAGAAMAAFMIGVVAGMAAVDGSSAPASAGVISQETLRPEAPVKILKSSVSRPAPFGIEDGAFHSAESLFVPLALADSHAEELKSRGVDLDQARQAASVIDELNAALDLAGFDTYRLYVAAVAKGERQPHPAVELAYPHVVALSVPDAANLRRALDYLAVTGEETDERSLHKTGRRPDPWKAAAAAIARAFGWTL